jgi:hypothetical protein
VCEHSRVSRTTVLVLVAIGAAIAGFAFSSNARRNAEEPAVVSPSVAASPQKATLGWREAHGERGERIVFEVETFEVTPSGWRADVAVINESTTSYEIASTIQLPFGLMIFGSADYETLTKQNEDGTLPPVRPAARYEPRLPTILEPGDSWSGTISAPGSLVANSWVRVAFGGLISVVQPNEVLAWISDHTYRLRL